MSISRDLFNKIRDKHGDHASWAVWNEPREGDERLSGGMDYRIFDNVTDELLSQLNPEYVFLGLNWSKGSVPTLMNFHSVDGNIGKLRYAIRRSPFYGAYMTDIIKNYSEPNAKELMKYLRLNPQFEKENVRAFENEISILGTKDPVIIALGNNVYDILKRHGIIEQYKVVKITHYSAPFGKGEVPRGEAGEYHKRKVMPVLVEALNCKPW